PLPLGGGSRTVELTGYERTGTGGRFRSGDFVTADPGDPTRLVHRFDSEIPYEDGPPTGKQRRQTEHIRVLYRPDDFGVGEGDALALLPLGAVEPRALTGETYHLAFTPGLLANVFE